MITRPMLLDETGQKIKLALQRVKNKFLGTATDPVTPGQAGSSGVSPVIQDDTGREIISALNDLADAVKPASATEQGLVSTGNQEFAGSKTFANPKVKQSDPTLPAAIFYFTADNLQNGLIMMSAYNAHNRYSLYRYQFRVFSLSSSTNEPLSNHESFRLPAPDFDRTDNGTYEIITTKNLTDIPDASATERGLVQFPIALDQGGTGATTAANARANLEVKPSYSWTLSSGVAASFNIPNNSRHMVVAVGSNPVRDGMFLLRASSTGVTQVTDIHKGTSLSYTTATNNFTITASGGVATIMFMTLTGSMVTKNV